MKKVILFFAICLLIAEFAHAAVRRVGFNPSFAITGVDYASMSAAVTAANSGDTIYIFPGTSFGLGGTLTKQLIMIGTGYFAIPGESGTTTPNNGLQILGATNSGAFTLGTGSGGSKFMSF